MSGSAKLIGAMAATAGSAAVLATVRHTALDVADGAVLVASLVALARTAIRMASDPVSRRGRGRS